VRLYVVAEDAGARVLLPTWIRALDPRLVAMTSVDDPVDHGFWLVSGGGYPFLRRIVADAVADIVDRPNFFDALVVVVDRGEGTLDQRRAEFRDQVGGLPCALRLVVADRCVETWALGNRSFIAAIPTTEDLRAWKAHHDVRERDPEALPLRPPHQTVEQCAAAYLTAAHRERRLAYNKARPVHLANAAYLDAVRNRLADTGHLASFRSFLEAFSP
jgi:hypothetical protein